MQISSVEAHGFNEFSADELELLISYFKGVDPQIASFDDEHLTHLLRVNKDPSFLTVVKDLQMSWRGAGFDYHFYQALYPDLRLNKVGNASEALTHFLNFGRGEGRFCNLHSWALDKGAASYLSEHVRAKDIVRMNEFRGMEITIGDFIKVLNGENSTPIAISEDKKENALFYMELGRNFLTQGERDRALQALKVSLNFHPEAKCLEFLGNMLFDDKHYAAAGEYYRKALALGSVSPWLYNNLGDAYLKLSQYEEASQVLLKGLARFPAHTFYEDKIDAIADHLWNEYQAKAQVLADMGERETLIVAANCYASKVYELYKLASSSLQKESLIKADSLDLNRRVLIVGDFHIEQCVRYRIEQKVEQLELAGWSVSKVDWTHLEKHSVDVATNSQIIFYRVPAVPKVLKVMAQAEVVGKKSYYEIDDYIFGTDYPPAIESYGGYVDSSLYSELMKGMALFNAAIGFCDLGIASTRPLADRLAELVRERKSFIHRNGLDSKSPTLPSRKLEKKNVDIFYGSGTKAHNTDFIELALPAIEKILTEFQSVRLVVMGHLRLPSAFRHEFKSQLIELEASSVDVYFSYLAHADINISVLCSDSITDCKSELKWTEAACFGIPSVVSGTENFKDVIRSGLDGLIAANPDDWYRSLKTLVINPTARSEMGNSAYLRVTDEYGLTSQAKNISGILSEKCFPRQKKKIAIVNVFYEPQNIGGATRVVCDNVRGLVSYFGDKYEVCVFTSDVNCREPYRLNVQFIDGVRVYRATIKFRPNMDWHEKDEDMYGLFSQFLDNERPDLVHFHCVQRMTASIVEATRDKGYPYFITLHDAWWISDYQFLVDEKDTVYPFGHGDRYSQYLTPSWATLGQSMSRRQYLMSLVSNSNMAFTVSNAFADIYELNGVERPIVIRNGISEAVRWEEKNTSYSDKVVLGHVGNVSAHKGFDIFKAAVLNGQPKNVEILVVDHGKDEGSEHLERWGEVRVRVIGRVKQEEVARLYKEIDVLFAPSIWPESFGLVTREAAACGCWVVASDLGGIGEEVVEGISGFKVSPSVEALQLVISQIDTASEKYKGVAGLTPVYFAKDQLIDLEKCYGQFFDGGHCQ
ncbi:glycosyltransferase [Pseudomonas oryzihabitans]|uniref:glycosyltransferase n=1 Tax=Pseudomonas oryzihabitans TaxID=47885 RepID=UPI0003065290|nr:glycosyltransferase [Pseudomonas psychrotolerans]